MVGKRFHLVTKSEDHSWVFKNIFDGELSRYYQGIALEIHDSPSSCLSTITDYNAQQKADLQGFAVAWHFGEMGKFINDLRQLIRDAYIFGLVDITENIMDAANVGVSQVLFYAPEGPFKTEPSYLRQMLITVIDQNNRDLQMLSLGSDSEIDLQGLPDGHQKINPLAAQEIIKDLSDLVEFVNKNNDLFSEALKAQLIAALKRLIISLEAGQLPSETSKQDTKLVAAVGKRVGDQALTQGIGTVFKRVANALFDVLSGL